VDRSVKMASPIVVQSHWNGLLLVTISPSTSQILEVLEKPNSFLILPNNGKKVNFGWVS